MERTALVIIDVQEALFLEEEKPCRGGEVVENIRLLLDKARARKIPVVYVQHEDEYMRHGSAEWQVVSRLAPLPEEPRVYKKTRDAFYQTELDAILKGLGVDTLIFCGMQTDYCVTAACGRAYTLGYKGFLASDAHTTMSNPVLSAEQIIAHHNVILRSKFLKVAPTADLLEAMDA